MRIYNPRLVTVSSSSNSINVETLTTDKQLTNTDAKTQDLTNPNPALLNLFLPSSPQIGKEFLFINDETSLGDFFTNNTVIYPGDRYGIVWNGTRWREV